MAKQDGVQEGKQEQQIMTVQITLKQGLPVELISKLTGLSIQEIQKIIPTQIF